MDGGRRLLCGKVGGKGEAGGKTEGGREKGGADQGHQAREAPLIMVSPRMAGKGWFCFSLRGGEVRIGAAQEGKVG
jgi:hypothetical protein